MSKKHQNGIIIREDYPCRKLKRITTKRIPENWLFIDTETKTFTDHKGESQRFRMGWVCKWIRSETDKTKQYEWKYFSDELKFNQYLSDTSRKMVDIILCGHNIFFDLQACGFFYYFTKWGWQLDFYYDRGLTYILRCRFNTAKLTIVSTTNWFDQSLKKLGKKLGIKKMDIDLKNCTGRELKQYCRRDVEILVKAMQYYIQFIQDNDLGRFCLTKASQAFSAYRYRFMDNPIYIHSNDEVTSLERQAYMGGRCEAFYIGKVPGDGFISLDVNGMYPYVMKYWKYPCKLVDYQKNINLTTLRNLALSFAVIAEVDVNTSEPVFAVRYKGKTIFPIGEFTCIVCTSGVCYGLAKDYIKKVHRVAVYLDEDLFSRYVDYFQSLKSEYRKSGNDIMELLVKYMHNCLYGKFGQKKIISDIFSMDSGRAYFREDIYDMINGGIVVQTRLMNKLIIQYQSGESEISLPAIAAHVTENARLTLWEIIKSTGRQRVLYCDTDSIKIRQNDLKFVSYPVDTNRLGDLKIEDWSTSLRIDGAKNYRTEKRRKIKGIPDSADESEYGTFTYDSFTRQTTHLRDGQIVGFKVNTVKRKLKTPYEKGIVHSDGSVTPLQFPLPE